MAGFRRRHLGIGNRVKSGDRLLCYMMRLSRWFGVLDVLEGPYVDESPIFAAEADPFVVRFRVKPTVWLSLEKGVPIHEDRLWNALSFTRGQSKSSTTWTGKLRGSLAQLTSEDGALLESVIMAQVDGGSTYPVDESEYRHLLGHRIRRADKDVSVTVPDDSPSTPEVVPPAAGEMRESIKIQALLAEVGSRMGMQIWIPRSDRSAVLSEWWGTTRLSWTAFP